MCERLWAPWRLQYIEAASSGLEKGSCIFCELPKLDDSQAHIVFRGELAFVLMNAYPYTNGHVMVAPYRHLNDLTELTPAEHQEIGHLVAECTRWIKEAYQPNGFNIGVNLGSAAGAGIPGHAHWHVVPRWAGDTNFMGVVGETRVLPQSLQESHARLHAVAKKG